MQDNASEVSPTPLRRLRPPTYETTPMEPSRHPEEGSTIRIASHRAEARPQQREISPVAMPQTLFQPTSHGFLAPFARDIQHHVSELASRSQKLQDLPIILARIFLFAGVLLMQWAYSMPDNKRPIAAAKALLVILFVVMYPLYTLVGFGLLTVFYFAGGLTSADLRRLQL